MTEDPLEDVAPARHRWSAVASGWRDTYASHSAALTSLTTRSRPAVDSLVRSAEHRHDLRLGLRRERHGGHHAYGSGMAAPSEPGTARRSPSTIDRTVSNRKSVSSCRSRASVLSRLR